jgi:CubicO group peptidase (beta-lactamase class C family)
VASAILDHPDVHAALDVFSAWVEYRMAYWAIPSIAVAIVHDQEMVWAHAFGHADIEAKVPATVETLYRIGSITKLFTATALVQLCDWGVLRLDDPIAAHLPWFKVRRDPEHETGELTIRHLLTHTSGLPRESPFPYWADFDFPSIAEVRAALDRQGTVLPPDTQWKYSNLAFVLAGEVVAAASGIPYAEYVEKHILEPLGMRDTFVQSPPPDHPQLARGYGRRFPHHARALRSFTDLRALTPAGNMTTTVLDLAKFAMLQFCTGRAGSAHVLAGATLREMHRIHWLEPGWQAGWGLGFRIVREDGRTCVGHGGLVAGYAAEFRLIPSEKIAIIVLTNAEDANPLLVAQRATKLVVPAVGAATKGREPARSADATWARYTGRYRNPWGDCQVMLGNGGLRIVSPVALDPSLATITLTPVAEHTFRVADPSGYGSHGELVRFEVGLDGEVTCMRIGEHPTYPLAEW